VAEEEKREEYRLDLSSIPVGVKCDVARNVALSVLSEYCSDRAAMASIFADYLGIQGFDPSKCSTGEPDEGTCRGHEIRRWVLCKAYEISGKYPTDFANAVRAAWEVAREVCKEKGVEL